MTRRTRIALVILGVLLVVRLALPYGIRAVLEAQGSEAIGRPVTVDDVSLSLARGAATISGIQVGSDAEPVVRAAEVTANLGALVLLTGEIRLESARVVEPALAIRLLEDGTIAPLVLAPEPAEPEPPASEAGDATIEEEGGGWPLVISELGLEKLRVVLVPSGDAEGGPAELDLGRLTLRDFSIVDGRIDFAAIGIESPRLRVPRELSIAPAAPAEPAPDGVPAPAEAGAPSISGTSFTIDDAQLDIRVGDDVVALSLAASVRDLRTGPGEHFPAKLRVEREGGWLEIEGEVGVQPVAFEGSVKLEGLSLEHVLYLADPETAARVKQGVLGGSLAVDVAVDPDGARVGVDGEISVAGLSVGAEGRKLDAKATRIEIAKLRMAPQPDGTPGVVAERARIQLDGLGFRDENVDPVALLDLLELRVDGKQLRWPENDLSLDLAFQGLSELAGSVTSRLEGGSGPTRIELAGFPLNNVSGYARPGGFLLNQGAASIIGDVSSEGPKHDANFDVSLDGLEVETVDAGAFEELFGMSPDLALAVLQDPTGTVRLPLHVDVDSSEGDGDLSLAQLMTGALRQAFTGIVTMPLKGLGVVARGVIGESGQLQMEPIAFEPGSSDWLEEEQAYIDAIAAGLDARPATGARVIGRALEDEARNPERLANRRAKAVAGALRDAGVAPEAIQLAEPVLGESGVVIEIVPRPPAGTEG